MRQVRRLKHLFAVVPLLFAVLGAANGQFPCGFTAKNLGSTSGTPVDLCQLDGTRHLVVEKRGVVTLLRTSPSSSKRVLDIQDKVRDGGEGGLLSCAVDPEFPREPWVYFGYIAHGGASAGQKRVSKFRYNIQAESIDKGSEVVLVGDCSAGGNMCMRQEREHARIFLPRPV